MREVDAQKMVIDVVRERGGAGYKLSSQFSVGVADLLLQLYKFVDVNDNHTVLIYPLMLLEVKIKRGDPGDVRPFTLDVTVPQQQFLRKFRDAGARVGVLSFLYRRNKSHMAAALFTLDKLDASRYVVEPGQHRSLGNHTMRDANLYQLLENYANG